MATNKGRSPIAGLINGLGFLLAAMLVMHVLFVLFRFPADVALVRSVGQAAVPLALFFPGLIDAHNAALQVLADFGLAAAFWVLLAGVLARVFA